ncbi:MAG: hypothetical protein HY332_12840 [Chloroflexi bacterium]|nr:hypothetical protein [Chloroflexota bacterium]
MLIDYHTHLPSPLASAPGGSAVVEPLPAATRWVAAYVARAAALGTAELGVSDHAYRFGLPRFYRPGDSTPSPELTVGAYYEAICAGTAWARSQHVSGVAVRAALEVDFRPEPGGLAELRAALAPYPWDYLLGSVHRPPAWPKSFEEAPAALGLEGPNAAHLAATHPVTAARYAEYFAGLQAAARCGLFQVLPHATMAARWLGPAPMDMLRPLWEATARTCRETGVCVELNGRGLSGRYTGLDPNPGFFRVCRAAGVGVTLGSDAHRLEDVAEGLVAGRDLLLAIGYGHLTTFVRRQPHRVSLL